MPWLEFAIHLLGLRFKKNRERVILIEVLWCSLSFLFLFSFVLIQKKQSRFFSGKKLAPLEQSKTATRRYLLYLFDHLSESVSGKFFNSSRKYFDLLTLC